MHRRRFLQGSLVTAGALADVSAAAQRSTPRSTDGDPDKLPPSIAALTSRKSEAVPITNSERAQRVERAQQLLQQYKMGALLLAGSTSLVYFTGLRWGNSERMMAYVIPAKGSAFIVCPSFEEDRVRERLSTVPSGESIRVYTWHEDESPYKLVGKGLLDAGLRTGSLGIEERTPFVFADGIAKACPGWHLVDGTPVSAGCRMIKSPAELALMRLANQVTLEVYEAAWKAGHPGMATSDFSALIGAGYNRVGFPGYASCETGIYSALPHGSITPQVIREDDIVLIDDGCTVEGYQSDISRTFVYGKPTDKMQQVFDIVKRAQTAAFEAAKSGSECQSVDAAARKVITDAGYGPDYKTFTHRLGHGIGMDGHEWTYLVRGNTTLLQSNMTFSDEPGIYLKGEFGVRLEDDMIITPKGGELFTPQSHSLTESTLR